MKIREINSYSELIGLKEVWNNTLKSAPHSIFSTWDWVTIWWKHFGEGRKLLALIAEEGNTVVGIAPLMCSSESIFGLPRTKIEFIGTPDSDYNNFIINQNYDNGDIVKLFVEYLNRTQKRWTLLNLTDIPDKANCLSYFKENANTQPVTKCSYIVLPQTYEDFQKSLSYKQRGSVNNTINKIKKNFSAELVDYSSPILCSEGMEHLIDLHQKRWQTAGLSGAFSNKRIRDFHKDVAKSLANQGMLGLYILKFDGKPVSGSYGFKYQSKYYAYLPGFDPEYSKFGVGSILVPYLVEKFIEEGLVEFDLMRGDEGYKERWNAIPTLNYQTEIYKSGIFDGGNHKLYDKLWRKCLNAKYLLRRISVPV